MIINKETFTIAKNSVDYAIQLESKLKEQQDLIRDCKMLFEELIDYRDKDEHERIMNLFDKIAELESKGKQNGT
jgi:hypothetical protein